MLDPRIFHELPRLPHLMSTVDHVFKAALLVAGAMVLEKNPDVVGRLNNALSELDLATQNCRSCPAALAAETNCTQ